MSPPVSPQQRRDRGSGPTDRGGSHPQPRSSFPARSAKQKNQQLRLFPNPSGAPRHLPYPRFTRGRGGHCCVSHLYRFKQNSTTLNSKPQSPNKKEAAAAPCATAAYHESRKYYIDLEGYIDLENHFLNHRSAGYDSFHYVNTVLRSCNFSCILSFCSRTYL